MNPIKIYDYLTTARLRLFDAVRPLSAEQYAREFPIGPGTLGRALTHIMASEWFYVQRMLEREVPPYETWEFREEHPPAFDVLEAAWIKQAEQTRAAIGEVRDWNAVIEYRSMGGEPMIVIASAADIFTQLVLHEVHHRAQALNILRHLGIQLDELDYNAMMYQRRKA